MRSFVLSAAMLVLALASVAFAGTPPTQDPDDEVFSATHIVIVAPGGPHSFTVERNYRGDRTVGSKIDLPTFELVTWENADKVLGHPRPVALTDATRILMFLQPGEKDPAKLEITDYGTAFFFRDVAKIDELETVAKTAIAQHRKWKEARDLPDAQDRIRGLFPYLLHSGSSCGRLTLKELAKLNPASGDYLATQLLAAPPSGGPLFAVCKLQSPKAHAAAIAVIDRACTRFKNYLNSHHLKEFDVFGHWDDLPKEVEEDYGVIYYGLGAINSFHDAADTPYIRGLVPLLMTGGFRQPIEECVKAMHNHPAPQNVPLLIAIWQDHQSRHIPPEASSLPIYIAGAMARQKDNRVIPALVEMFEIRQWHDEALCAMRDLTGQGFGTAKEWKAWYAAQPATATKPEATGKPAP